MKKRAGITILAFALIIGGMVGVRHYVYNHQPIEIETVKDMNTKTEKDNQAAFKLQAKSAVLIDADSGTVLMEQDAHKELPPASVTKVMTMLLTMEAVHDGRVTMDDKVTISERAASMGGSQMFMEVGETHSVSQLLQGIAIVSANDACASLANCPG